MKADDPQDSVFDLIAPPGYTAAERLDQYLTDKLPSVSRSKVQRMIKDGRVRVNLAVETRPSRPVQARDAITVHLPRPPRIEAQPEDIPLEIVYEDEELIVIDKPAGMVVHPAYGHPSGTLVNALLHHVGAGPVSFERDDDDDDELGEEVGLSTAAAGPRYEGDAAIRPGIVHRLDKDTSGLLVVAKTDAAHARLAAQFMARTTRRRYLAIVWGVPDPPSGTVETALGRAARDRKRVAVVPPERGRHAITHYEVLEAMQHTALVAFRLETGRTHQIRVHAAHIGHPVLGDATYGGDRIRYGPDTATRRKFFANLFARLPRQALHAQALGFKHPTTGEDRHFESPLPDDMAWALERLRTVEG